MCKPTNLSSPSATATATAAATATTTNAKDSQQTSLATRNFEGCGVDRSCPTSVTSHSCQNVRLDQYQSATSGIRRRSSTTTTTTSGGRDLDHEFVWFDLDAIREKAAQSRCDGIAGLLFTTKGQVLNDEAEANTTMTIFTPHHHQDKQRRTSSFSTSSKQLLEFDSFVWPTFSLHNPPPIEESSDDQKFREQIEELEDELYCGDEFAASESTMSSFHW